MAAVRTLRPGEAVAVSSLSGSRRSPDDLLVHVGASGAAPDVVALVLGPDGRVRSDGDLVFFNQPSAAGGAVTVDAGTVRIRTSRLEDAVARVLVGCAGGALDAGARHTLRVDVSHPRDGVLASAVIDVPERHRAETVLEVYRWGTGWRLRLLGEGYVAGLEGLARDHGVQVDGAAAPSAPPVVVPPPVTVPPPPTSTSTPATTSTFAPLPGPAVWNPTPVPTRPPTSKHRGRRTPVLIGTGALAVVAVVVVAGLGGGSDPEPSPRTAVPAAAAAASTAASTTAVATPTVSATPLPAASTAVVPATSAAQAALALLPVKGRAPQTGYDRAQFGQAWADVDRNGCDTRNDVLRRDVDTAVIDPATNGCVVLSGTVADPYSGTTIPFTRGAQTSAAVQIDHVVALGDAWQTGAQQFDATRRAQFANDPANLLAVDGALNAQKGDGDAATWLPPNRAFRCTYVTQQVTVKQTYGLWVTAAERDAIARVLAGCPGATTPPPPPAAPTPTLPSTPAVPPPADTGSVSYQNCDAVRAAGKAPLLAGEPGYSRKLDRDGDGIACEN